MRKAKKKTTNEIDTAKCTKKTQSKKAAKKTENKKRMSYHSELTTEYKDTVMDESRYRYIAH